MKAEIICIGTELLLGHIINTNASFIARNLAEIGIDHYFQTTVGDNHRRLADTLTKGLDRSDIVITTGGLGPTVDDITTQVIANITNKKLVLEKAVLKEINEFFKKQSKKIPRDSLRQALIPEGAKWLKNPFGTAPGLIISISPHPTLSPKGRGFRGEGSSEKIIIALPGPPREMNPMVKNHVIPYLKKRVKAPGARDQGSQIIKSRAVRLIGLAEAKVNEKVKDLLNLGGPVQVGIYAKQGEVELKIMAKAQNQKLADKEINKIEKLIRKRLNPYIYGADKETLEGTVVDLLIKKKKSIAIAESCTGGLLANLITNVSGASNTFIEGIICYSNESKVKEVNVKRETLKKYGAVSPQIAKEMAWGIRKKAGADIGIGITGIAGPTSATKSKPVGLIYIAVSMKNKTQCRQFNFLGSRVEIKHQSAQAALNLIRCELS